MSRHQYEYKQAMDSIHVTPEWEDQMINNLMNSSKEKAAHRAPRLGLAMVAAAACLTIGAGAAEATNGAVSELFAPLFGTAHTEIIDSIGYPVGVSDTAGGVKITADAIIGDANNICVIYTLEKEDGSGWDEVTDAGYLVFEDSTFDFHVDREEGNGWVAHGSSWFIDDDPADGVIQFVEQRTVDGGTPSGSAKETLKNLCVWDGEAQTTRVLAKGKWTLRFDLKFEDTTRQYPAGQAVDFLGAPGMVTDITVSPIAFRVAVDLDRTEFELQDDRRYLDGESEALDQLSVLLRLKDGRELDLGGSAGGSVSVGETSTEFVKSALFNEVIALEDMESIVVCGVEIPLR